MQMILKPSTLHHKDIDNLISTNLLTPSKIYQYNDNTIKVIEEEIALERFTLVEEWREEQLLKT